MERDVRWEKVYASIARPDVSVDDPYYEALMECWEIRIDVPYGKTVFYNWQRFHQEVLEGLDGPKILAFFLDRMVSLIDQDMEEWDQIVLGEGTDDSTAQATSAEGG